VTATRAAAILFVAIGAASCGDSDDPYDLTDGAVVGDTSSYEGIDYELTSDNYRRWTVANALLDSMGISPDTRISTRDPSDDEIEDVIDAIENDERARAALDSADISAKDYVLTTIALAQSWDAVNRPGMVVDAPSRNIALVREEVSKSITTRPTSRYVDDDRPRKRGKGKGKARGRGKAKRGKG
jgi:hypothetical protein